MNVNRHTGGLETIERGETEENGVNRHTGGLERPIS